MEAIRVAICDDSVYLCEGLSILLTKEEDITVCGTVQKAADCVGLIRREQPDVLLLDIQMETQTKGLEIIDTLKAEHDALKIIMLTNSDALAHVLWAVISGASGYVMKTFPDEELIRTIRDVHCGRYMIDLTLVSGIAKHTALNNGRRMSFVSILDTMMQLSKGEFKLLREIYNGKSYRELANARVVEIETIRMMSSRILKKLGAKNMRELIDWIRRLGLFE
ncbi:MAG: response regulator transcription factor [Clostridiales bacterium]|jgi:two-component system response regulator NreC|nr:response regulator transcription factor [Clostridiales bacterium]